MWFEWPLTPVLNGQGHEAIVTECSEPQFDPSKVLQQISTLAAKSVHDGRRMCEPLYLDFDSLMVDLILLNLLNKI
ncbi:hypothetical protein COL26b_011445 [Colletotrichum chrysophilum]|uniref:uncharacterized protein n=1 Tax=Colletotrichum chrysophilum TaxID=1836956 RepID=UPI0023000723|nr:uncharacterized protein COL26b_011445 [Colletotrichum chrysophilum]KAJ0367090.1 hypothetical protein COL26b_011445 [Colletotrichum chrysophilum]